ncbi:MAG: hypothetical protein ACSHXD_10120 [Marinosulfonomonas sp.]
MTILLIFSDTCISGAAHQENPPKIAILSGILGTQPQIEGPFYWSEMFFSLETICFFYAAK